MQRLHSVNISEHRTFEYTVSTRRSFLGNPALLGSFFTLSTDTSEDKGGSSSFSVREPDMLTYSYMQLGLRAAILFKEHLYV